MSKVLKLVQIGRRDLQLNDETYRDLLEQVTGQRSAKGLSDSALGLVVDRMKLLGFVPLNNKPAFKRKPYKKVTKPQRTKAAETSKITAIWLTMHQQGFVRNAHDSAIDAYVKRQTSKKNGGIGVERLTWLDSQQAYFVLEALKKWHYRMMVQAIDQLPGKSVPCVHGKLVGYDALAHYYHTHCC